MCAVGARRPGGIRPPRGRGGLASCGGYPPRPALCSGRSRGAQGPVVELTAGPPSWCTGSDSLTLIGAARSRAMAIVCPNCARTPAEGARQQPTALRWWPAESGFDRLASGGVGASMRLSIQRPRVQVPSSPPLNSKGLGAHRRPKLSPASVDVPVIVPVALPAGSERLPPPYPSHAAGEGLLGVPVRQRHTRR
jgi:hypothetical protein